MAVVFIIQIGVLICIVASNTESDDHDLTNSARKNNIKHDTREQAQQALASWAQQAYPLVRPRIVVTVFKYEEMFYLIFLSDLLL